VEGSDFESAKLLQNIKYFYNKKHCSLEELRKHVEPCCMVLCRTMQAQQHVQEDKEKKNNRRTELYGDISRLA
jgi:hypothetical protein